MIVVRIILMVFLCIIVVENTYSAAVLDEIEDAIFNDSLKTVKGYVGGGGPSCFISRAFDQGAELDKKCDVFKDYLKNAGVNTLYDTDDLLDGQSVDSFMEQIGATRFVVVLFTPKYKERSQLADSGVSAEVGHIVDRLRRGTTFYIPVILAGTPLTSIPESLRPMEHLFRDVTDWNKRFEVVFEILGKMLRALPQLPAIRADFMRERAAIDGYSPASLPPARHSEPVREDLAHLSLGASAPVSSAFEEEGSWGGGGSRPIPVDSSSFGLSAGGGVYGPAGSAGVYGYPTIDYSTWGGGFLGEMGFGAPAGGMPGLGGGYGVGGSGGPRAFGHDTGMWMGSAAAMGSPTGGFMEAGRSSGKSSPAAGSAARGIPETAAREYDVIQNAYVALAFSEGSMQDVSAAPPAYDALKRRADAGNHLAQGWLFNLIYTKRSPFKDNVNGPWAQRLYELSIEWVLKSAAEGNNPYSQTLLGSIYALGINVTADPDEAVKWRQKAAEQDNPLAQYDLGVMYWEGMAGADGKSKGAEWMKKSARQGFSGARKFLMKNKMLW